MQVAHRPATLYYSTGTKFKRDKLKRSGGSCGAGGADDESKKCEKRIANNNTYTMLQRDRREEVVIIASERLTSVREDWVKFPPHVSLSSPYFAPCI